MTKCVGPCKKIMDSWLNNLFPNEKDWNILHGFERSQLYATGTGDDDEHHAWTTLGKGPFIPLQLRPVKK